MVVNASSSTFQEEVLDSQQAVLVDFWAPWCGHCSRLSPVLDEVAGELGDELKVVKVNVDDNRDLASQYNVKSLPTMLVMKAGQVGETLMGFMPKSVLLAKVKPHL
jgi:thioredoxin 1